MTDEERERNMARIRAYLDTLSDAERRLVVDSMERALQIAFADKRNLEAVSAALSKSDLEGASRLIAQVEARRDERTQLDLLLKRHDAAVDVSIDGEDLFAVYERLIAKIDLLQACTEAGLSEAGVRYIASIGPEEHPDLWPGIEASVRLLVAEHPAEVGATDEQHLLAYTRMVIASHVLKEHLVPPGGWAKGADAQLMADDQAAIERAMVLFYGRHIKAPEPADYASGVTDLLSRIRIGALQYKGDHLDDAAHAQWMADVDLFLARAGRHEFTNADVQAVLGLMMDVERHIGAKRQTIGDNLARLRALINRYESGPAHMVAMAQQWLAYKVNQSALGYIRDGQIRALQPVTVEALRRAETYCWSPQTVEAVSAVAQGMPGDCALTPTALGDLALPGKAGWWWFQEPVPVQTTAKSFEVAPVVALLWKREHHSEFGPRVFCQTFVDSMVNVDGRRQAVPIPSAAWWWPDGLTLVGCEAHLREHYTKRYGEVKEQLGDIDAAGLEATVQAALWFSRFFIAGAMWLRQRVLTPTAGVGIRQVARQLAREYKLPETPTVQVIELRRTEREMLTRAKAAVGDATGDGSRRMLHCRFVVGGLFGFTRNQWYPSRGENAPKWIAPFWKGPADAPVRTAPRVYAVRR